MTPMNAACSAVARSRSAREPAPSYGKRTWHRRGIPASVCGEAIRLRRRSTEDDVHRHRPKFDTPTDPAYVNCIKAGHRPKFCLSAGDYVDLIVALDIRTGWIKWSRRLTDGDDYNLACLAKRIDLPPPARVGKNCPGPGGADMGADFDFGSAPNEFSVRVPEARGHHDGHRDEQRDVIGAGQKSGMYSAFDADTGDFLWGTQVGPGGSLGGSGGVGHRRRADLRRDLKFRKPAILSSRHWVWQGGFVERSRSDHRRDPVADTRS